MAMTMTIINGSYIFTNNVDRQNAILFRRVTGRRDLDRSMEE